MGVAVGHDSNSKKQVILLELNELNFEYIEAYLKQGRPLPNFKELISKFGYIKTTSEKEYEKLEPWIQWVSAHTGLTYNDHRVFRLGDGPSAGHRQIWEALEQEKGISVGAISPMNASNNTKYASYFVPDPWTKTRLAGPKSLKLVYNAISQAVNDNARQHIGVKSYIGLFLGAALNFRLNSTPLYTRYILRSRQRKWCKALLLDRLLADLYISQTLRTKPQFSSLFLNAGAHIQHHYMFSSSVYNGRMENPEWYIRQEDDPLYEVIKLYDIIIGNIVNSFQHARVMLSTGLHQEPHEKLTYYYRLKNHKEFLKSVGVYPISIYPYMSRDFSIVLRSPSECSEVATKLESARDMSGISIFSVDARKDNSLFVTLEYDKEIGEKFDITIAGQFYPNFNHQIVFVAIKNGHHHSVGYFLDSHSKQQDKDFAMPLTQVYYQIMQAF